MWRRACSGEGECQGAWWCRVSPVYDTMSFQSAFIHKFDAIIDQSDVRSRSSAKIPEGVHRVFHPFAER